MPQIGYKQLLKNRNFALLWIAQSVSLLGDTIFAFSINWLILEKTGSALQVGGNVIIAILANIIFGSIAGVLADKWNRRRLLISSDCLRGLLVLGLALALHLAPFNIWYIYIVNFLLTSISTFFYPAFQASIPNVLDKEELVAGRSLTTGTLRLLQAVGSALSGILIITLGTQLGIIVNGLSFFFSAFAIFLTRIPQPLATLQSSFNLSSIVSQVVDGWQYIRSKLVLLNLFFLFALSDFGAAFTWPVHVVFAEKVLGGGPQLYGYLSTAALLGSFVGAYFIGRYSRKINQHAGLGYFWAAFTWGLLSIGFALTSLIPMALAYRFLIGVALSVLHIPIASLVDTNTVDEYRGRTWATISMGSSIVSPVSVLLSGVIADHWSARVPFVIAGLILILSAFVALGITSIREARIEQSKA